MFVCMQIHISDLFICIQNGMHVRVRVGACVRACVRVSACVCLCVFVCVSVCVRVRE